MAAPPSASSGGGCEEEVVAIEVVAPDAAAAIVEEEERGAPALATLLLLLLLFLAAFVPVAAALLVTLVTLEGAAGVLKEALGVGKEAALRSISFEEDRMKVSRQRHNAEEEMTIFNRTAPLSGSRLAATPPPRPLLPVLLPQPPRPLLALSKRPRPKHELFVAAAASSSTSPSSTSTTSSSSPSPALQAPPPSATRPGEAWAELVPSTRQFEALKSAFVALVSEPEAGPVPVSSFLLVGGGEEKGRNERHNKKNKTLLVVARSFGCPFCQDLAASLATQAIPRLDDAGISLYLISIGTPETGKQFAELTGFPAERLLADPGTQTYDALGLERGLAAAFLSPRTPLAIVKRASTAEGREGLGSALGKWKAFLPPRVLKDSTYQGGAFVFVSERKEEEEEEEEEAECVWARLDRATADHAPAEELLEVALRSP